jgi:predicted secreted protein
MKSKMRLLSGVILLAVFVPALCTPFGAATATGWSKTYGGSGDDEAYSLVQTSDGGYALAGYTNSSSAGSYDFWLIKTNSSGNMQWNRTYGGTGDDEAYSVVQSKDEGYAVAGVTDSFGAGETDAWLVKTDSSGDMQWNRTYGGRAEDGAYSVIQTSDGGYALAGYTDSFGAGSFNFWLIKTDSTGSMTWNKTYGGPGDDEAECVIQTSDGGYALAGYTNSFGAGSYDFWLVKTDSSGSMTWNKTYGGPGDDEARCVIQTSDGGYALVGMTNSTGAGGYDFWLVKTDSYGTLQWSQTYGGAYDEIANAVVQTSDGGYALAGLTGSYGAGDIDYWLVKTTSSGSTQWSQTYGGSGDDEAYSLVQTSDGGYALAGFTTSYGAGSYDAFLVKTDSSGKSVMPQSSPFSIPYSFILILLVIAVIIIAAAVIARSRRRKPDTSTGPQYPPTSPEVNPQSLTG